MVLWGCAIINIVSREKTHKMVPWCSGYHSRLWIWQPGFESRWDLPFLHQMRICDMPFKRSKLLETQLAFRKKELRRSKLLEKPITFSRFTLRVVWESLSQFLASPVVRKLRNCSVKPFCKLRVKWTRSQVNPVFFCFGFTREAVWEKPSQTAP